MVGEDLNEKQRMPVSKPLRILTIDGGGLQAISTLGILNKVLEAIGQQNGVQKLRPCDVFDTIAGIGAGGWLAILLGRFRMDITSCLSEWYKINRSITPRSKTEKLRLRLFQHSYFDMGRLVNGIDELAQLFGTGDCLFEPDPAGARTRHVIVAALNSDASGYNLFRSYPTPPKLRLREGPKDPDSFKISSAFGATGAAKHFSAPWKEQMADGGIIKFSDTKYPKPHNITELVLDEMWGIYGTDVPLSVVLNIGPGLPNEVDVKHIEKRFSWGLNTASPYQTASTGGVKPFTGQNGDEKQSRSDLSPQVSDLNCDYKRNSVHCHDDARVKGDRKRSIARTTTFGSFAARDMDTIRRLEDDIEADIRKKLAKIYPNDPLIYYRLAPPEAAQGTSQNDLSESSSVALDHALEYLNTPLAGKTIDEVAKRIEPVTAS